MNVMAVMRVRQDRPQRAAGQERVPNDGRARSRSSAHTEKRIVAVNVSSRQPSTPHVTISSSVAVSSAASRPASGDRNAAPTRYVAKIASVDPTADARLTP